MDVALLVTQIALLVVIVVGGWYFREFLVKQYGERLASKDERIAQLERLSAPSVASDLEVVAKAMDGYAAQVKNLEKEKTTTEEKEKAFAAYTLAMGLVEGLLTIANLHGYFKGALETDPAIAPSRFHERINREKERLTRDVSKARSGQTPELRELNASSGTKSNVELIRAILGR